MSAKTSLVISANGLQHKGVTPPRYTVLGYIHVRCGMAGLGPPTLTSGHMCQLCLLARPREHMASSAQSWWPAFSRSAPDQKGFLVCWRLTTVTQAATVRMTFSAGALPLQPELWKTRTQGSKTPISQKGQVDVRGLASNVWSA